MHQNQIDTNYKKNNNKFPIWYSCYLIKLLKLKNSARSKYKKYKKDYHRVAFELYRRDFHEEADKCYKKYLLNIEKGISFDPKKILEI